MKLIFCLTVCWLAAVTHQSVLPNYELEIYFVVDAAVVNRYTAEQTDGDTAKAMDSLNADIDYFITEINDLYSSLAVNGFNIQILKKKLDILDFIIFNDNTDVDPGLKAFDAWLMSTNAYANIGYDAAILWTGFELVSGNDQGVAGYAHVGQICKAANSSGIVEYDMTYLVSITTAHELGHIIGAGHDSDVTGFIMIPKSSVKEDNRWKFSLCSKEAFQASVDKLSTNCLLDSSPESTAQAVEVTDALADPNTICRRSEQDASSYMCRNAAFYEDVTPQGDIVCKSIYCKVAGTTYCSTAFPSDGLICGTNKRCDDGTCIDSPDSESALVDNNCIWGDQPIVKFSTNLGPYEGDCPGLIDFLGKASCSSASVAEPCCKTCEDLKTGIPGCDYGDEYHSCNSYTQAQICDNYAGICCEFCHGYRKKRNADSNDGSDTVTLDLPPIKVEVTNELKRKPETPPPNNGGPTEQT